MESTVDLNSCGNAPKADVIDIFTGQKLPDNLDEDAMLAVRVQRIKSSIQKISSLMRELNEGVKPLS